MSTECPKGVTWCTGHTDQCRTTLLHHTMGEAPRLTFVLSQDTERGGTFTQLSYQQGGAPCVATLPLAAARELLQGLAVAVKVMEAASIATCEDCGAAYEPPRFALAAESDLGCCPECEVDRRRARRPRLVRS